ncbi:MAG: class I SAM-dependent methyltransferase, partial [Thermodesulfobacteriota bacterium]
MNKEISWSRLFDYRDQIHVRYREIWDLKILRKRFPLMVKNIRNGEKILDIGASNRNLEERLKRHYPNLIYKSMDVDRKQSHDFYSIEEIRETFDVIFLFEVIEHLELGEGVQLLKRSYDLLNEGGRLILTTPNVFNPSRFWRDATHRVAYCYDELGGLLLAQGFSITAMYRTYNDVSHRYFFRVYVMAPVHRYLGIDFAKSILIVAEKKL